MTINKCTCSNECRCDTFQIGECDFCSDRKCQSCQENEQIDFLWQSIVACVPKHIQIQIRIKYNQLIDGKDVT